MNRILIADDEPGITSFIEKGLRKHGFSTFSVHDGETAVRLARDDDFDLLVLDLGMPRRGGLDVLHAIRARGERMAVIVLTAQDGIDTTVKGFEAGADDYMTKPFRFDELLVRVRARLRAPADPAVLVLRSGGIELDLRTRAVRRCDGEEVALSAREFALLETLMRHAGAVLSREQLLSRVWGYGSEVGSNVVEVYIGYLRRKLGSGTIETVRGAGYRFAT